MLLTGSLSIAKPVRRGLRVDPANFSVKSKFASKLRARVGWDSKVYDEYSPHEQRNQRPSVLRPPVTARLPLAWGKVTHEMCPFLAGPVMLFFKQ
jgi:hypothetical protein